MIDPLVNRAIAVAFALLLLAAAWHKASARDAFMGALGEYRLLPERLLRPASRLIPGIEAALGLAWLVAYTPAIVAPLTTALLGVYAAAIAINLRRGRVHIGCGCGFGGGSGADQPLSWGLVVRNVLLAAVALLATLPTANRELGAYDWLTLGLALTTCAVLYSGASQLLRNGTAIAAWRHRHD